MNNHTRLTTLIETWQALRNDSPLPEPVMVGFEPTINQVTIQVGQSNDPLDRISELLLWAYTLKQVSAQWWHTSSGDLHITIRTAPTTDVTFRVYGGIPFAHCADLIRLAPNESESVSLDEMSTLLGLLREYHSTITEVAA